MYVLVLLMFMPNGFKVASDQVIYPTMDMCIVSLEGQLDRLNMTKPTPASQVVGKCVEMPEVENTLSL